MSKKNGTKPAHTQQPGFATGNDGLRRDIATLQSIYDGEYDHWDVDTHLRHVSHNLARLRNLTIEHDEKQR